MIKNGTKMIPAKIIPEKGKIILTKDTLKTKHDIYTSSRLPSTFLGVKEKNIKGNF